MFIVVRPQNLVPTKLHDFTVFYISFLQNLFAPVNKEYLVYVCCFPDPVSKHFILYQIYAEPFFAPVNKECLVYACCFQDPGKGCEFRAEVTSHLPDKRPSPSLVS